VQGHYTVVFTDLDGTLLDHDTYEWRAAEPALRCCRRLNVPVVMVSSKTRAEMEPLRVELGLDWPFVYENGGGIFFPSSCPLEPPAGAKPVGVGRVLALGASYEELVAGLRELRRQGWEVRGFSDMTVEEIAELTGLGFREAEQASQREFDEPFVIVDPESTDIGMLFESIAGRGLKVTRGGRFYHLFESCDKGLAVDLFLSWLSSRHPCLKTIGLGDSPNDIPMLERVDVPILVRSAGPMGEMEDAVPGIRITEEIGPVGWNRVVLELLNES